MKMGPSTADASAALCKPAYGGNVYLYYSLDGGAAWDTLTTLETFSYRAEDFTEVCMYVCIMGGYIFTCKLDWFHRRDSILNL